MLLIMANQNLYACSGACTPDEIFNCNLYLGIADAYVEYGQMGNTNCMDQTLEKLKVYGMAFWLMHTQSTVDFMTAMQESLPETCCICNDCDTIKGILRVLGENCHPTTTT
jgi:hypothetical protein